MVPPSLGSSKASGLLTRSEDRPGAITASTIASEAPGIHQGILVFYYLSLEAVDEISPDEISSCGELGYVSRFLKVGRDFFSLKEQSAVHHADRYLGVLGEEFGRRREHQ